MNKNHHTIKLLTITTLLLTTLSFAKVDKFNLQEEQNRLSDRVFNHYDTDKNHALSLHEFSTFSKDMKQKEMEKRMKKTIKSCDKNNNGKIERSEIPTEEEMMKLFEEGSLMMRQKICRFRELEFEEIDQNEDNISTTEEMIKFYTKSRYSRPKMLKPNKEKIEKNALKGFKQQLKHCDKNSDNNITLIEITAEKCYMTSDVFLQYSTDPKGSFEIDKITKAPKDEMQDNYYLQMIERGDKDGDKKLDLVEATSNKCHLSSDEFSRIDQNKDKFLTNAELSKKAKELMKPTQIFKINENMMKRMPPQVQVRMAFSMCNRDGDQKLTMKEAEDCNLSMEHFKKFDTDKSNTIEPNDMEKMEMVEGFKMVDINEDKKIDSKEFSERMGSRCRVF